MTNKYDPSTGVSYLKALELEDQEKLNRWILENFHRLDKIEIKKPAIRKLVLDHWDKNPDLLDKNWSWLTNKEKRARSQSFFWFWRRK